MRRRHPLPEPLSPWFRTYARSLQPEPVPPRYRWWPVAWVSILAFGWAVLVVWWA